MERPTATGESLAADALQQHFQQEHASRDDPWGVTTRWYEIRKRQVLLSSLPEQRYGSVLEIGCSIGVVTEALAARSDRVLALDLAESAVASARRRLSGVPSVTVQNRDVRQGLPDGPYDLVVLSEVGYYLDHGQLVDLLAGIEAVLAGGGALVACHWRHPEDDFMLSGEAVHRILGFETVLERLVHHEERDFLLDVYSADDRSVAQRTGLV